MPSEIDLTPTAEMAANAERGLRLREKHGRGGTEVGVARARDLKNRKTLSPDTVRRMHSFFARHAGNEEGGEDDAGYIAWLLWGGDAGKAWAARKVGQIDKKENSMKNGKKAAMAKFKVGDRIAYKPFPIATAGEIVEIKQKRANGDIQRRSSLDLLENEYGVRQSNGSIMWISEGMAVKASRPGAKAAFGTPDEALTVFTTLAEAEKASINGNRAKAKQLLQSIAALIARDRSKLPAGAVAFYEEMKAKVGMSRPGAKSTHAADDAVSKKIAKLIREGYPRDQAVAIAYDMKRRGEI